MVAAMNPIARCVVCLILLVLAACADAATQIPLDDAARAYVRMALEIGTYEKDYVDAYYGPPEWRTEAEAHPRTIPELKAEAARIHAALDAIDPAPLHPLEGRRRVWLTAHVASAETRLLMIGGARFRFDLAFSA